MEQFTVKDFITYNNPCFSCGEKIIFTFGEAINPVIDGNECKIQLVTNYANSLSLTINLKNNRFKATNPKVFKKYIKKKKIKLKSVCNKCKSHMFSSYLEFDLDKNFIKPCTIVQEYLNVLDKNFIYLVFNSHGGTILRIQKAKSGEEILDLDVDHELNRGTFKTREKLINKMKTYLLFS